MEAHCWWLARFDHQPVFLLVGVVLVAGNLSVRWDIVKKDIWTVVGDADTRDRLCCCFYIAVLYPVNRWIFVLLDERFWQWPTSCLQNYRAADGLKNWTCYSLQNYLFGFWIACSIKVRCAETGGWLASCVGKMWSPHGHEIHITVDGGNLPVFNQ